MTISRRKVIGGIALSPIWSAVSPLLAHSQALPGATQKDICWVNILIHGLFLMEFKQNAIEITAPDILDHRYCMLSNGFLTEFPSNKPLRMNFGTTSLAGLLPGKIISFEDYPAIPQFSKTQTGVGDLVGQKYRLKIELPLPLEILPLRCGSLSDFSRGTESGRVRDSIISACGKNSNDKFAMVTCFRYLKENTNASPPVATHSFYAEHMLSPDASQTNQAYAATSQLFSNPGNFDLRIKVDQTKPLPPVYPDFHPGYGISSDDERSLPEIVPKLPGSVVDVGSCIQLGFHG